MKNSGVNIFHRKLQYIPPGTFWKSYFKYLDACKMFSFKKTRAKNSASDVIN